ncbi:4'-phosphopantetheinyl transferase superfamily protein [Streptomyces gobiensis]|uniref:4'-phosphopantetheinyl transferase superfamily protein n=1 Tax=Streptomyces gobiensis TaxID=2875706 RepID=UPI001E509FC8|nr:4'-phosphopantetheinyl transferase superfamily protein [Streptomyces gobiensis]UGY91463.1 4'-phosphopantetheinyl transferase superfamily protein [Streptomyces gobiensis]
MTSVTPMIRVLAVCARRPLPEANLTPPERKRYSALPGQARKEQWLASRHALKLLLGLTGVSPDTSRYTFPHPRISLTHTTGAGVAAVAVGGINPCPSPSRKLGASPPGPRGRWGHLVGIGVDIERDRQAPADAARFFLDERERAWLSTVPAAARATEQIRLWTVKEALFKANPGNRHTLLRDYSTHHAAARSGRARGPARHTVFGYATARLGDAHLSIAAAFHPAPATRGRNTPVPAITFDEVAQRISKTLSIPVEELTPGTTLRELAADSFRLVEMAVDLEEEFDAMFTDVELREVTTLGELADLVHRSH